MNTADKVFALLRPGITVSLASISLNGFPRPVPMKIVAVDKKKDIWFASSLKSEKVVAYKKNPRAGMSYNNEDISVSLQGKIWIVEDKTKKREMWSEAMSLYFPEGANTRDYCLLRFVPELLRATRVKDIYKYEVKTIMLLSASR